MNAEKRIRVAKDIAAVLNKHSVENDSNTPDYILAAYLMDCLQGYADAVRCRDEGYGIKTLPDVPG